MDFEQICTKYNKSTNLIDFSFDEIKKDLVQIKPTYKPIIDICTIRIIGDFVNKMMVQHMWNQCPNLAEEILQLTTTIVPEVNISLEEIINNINSLKSKDTLPSSAIFKLYDIVSDNLKTKINMCNKSDIEYYMNFRSKYHQALETLKLKYIDNWNELEEQVENLNDIIGQNFIKLENNKNFQTTMEIIDEINDIASNQVNKLIGQTTQTFNDILEQKIETGGVQSVLFVEDLKRELVESFNVQLEQIYVNVISAKKFDTYSHNIILSLYDVNKEMHRMSLTLELGIVLFNKMLK